MPESALGHGARRLDHDAHADGSQETVGAGEVYHWPAGHTGITDHGVVFIEVGPVDPMREFAVNARRVLGL